MPRALEERHANYILVYVFSLPSRSMSPDLLPACLRPCADIQQWPVPMDAHGRSYVPMHLGCQWLLGARHFWSICRPRLACCTVKITEEINRRQACCRPEDAMKSPRLGYRQRKNARNDWLDAGSKSRQCNSRLLATWAGLKGLKACSFCSLRYRSLKRLLGF